MADYQLIVIGAGPGGYEAALRAAKLGKRVAVVERREAGGTCLNRGCIPTKTLLHASAIYRDAKNGAHCGIHTEDIHADMAEIFAYKRAVSQKLSAGIESLFKTAKIDLLRGTALITGFTAKESVVSTLTVLLGGDTGALNMLFTPFTALVFLIFTLLYTPCVAAIAAVKRELGGGRAALGVVLMQCGIAWVVAFAVHCVGFLLGLA